VYDISTSKWHERKSRLVVNGLETIYPWRAVNIVYAYGEMYAGDSLDGHIGRVRQDIQDEYSYEIIRTFATQPFQNNMDPFFVPSIELTIEQGTGSGDAASVDAQICNVYACDALVEELQSIATSVWVMDMASGSAIDSVSSNDLAAFASPAYAQPSILVDNCGELSSRWEANNGFVDQTASFITNATGSIGGYLKPASSDALRVIQFGIFNTSVWLALSYKGGSTMTAQLEHYAGDDVTEDWVGAIDSGGNFITNLKTASIDIKPDGTGNLVAYWDTKGLYEDNYNMNLHTYFQYMKHFHQHLQ